MKHKRTCRLCGTTFSTVRSVQRHCDACKQPAWSRRESARRALKMATAMGFAAHLVESRRRAVLVIEERGADALQAGGFVLVEKDGVYVVSAPEADDEWCPHAAQKRGLKL